MPDPTVSERAQGQLLRAEMALLDALAERERWVHTVNLLHARIGRLRATPSHDHPDPALAHAARPLARTAQRAGRCVWDHRGLPVKDSNDLRE